MIKMVYYHKMVEKKWRKLLNTLGKCNFNQSEWFFKNILNNFLSSKKEMDMMLFLNGDCIIIVNK